MVNSLLMIKLQLLIQFFNFKSNIYIFSINVLTEYQIRKYVQLCRINCTIFLQFFSLFYVDLAIQALIQPFYISGNRTLTHFLKIMQSFFFDAKHLENRLNMGGEIFGALFSKKYLFWPLSGLSLSTNTALRRK